MAADIQKNNNSNAVFWQGLRTGMTLAASVGLAAFGLVAVFMTGMALFSGSPLIAGILPATPLVGGGVALAGAGFFWGGIKSVLMAGKAVPAPTAVFLPPEAVSTGAFVSLKKSFGCVFSRKKSIDPAAPKFPKHDLS